MMLSSTVSFRKTGLPGRYPIPIRPRLYMGRSVTSWPLTDPTRIQFTKPTTA